MLNISLKHKPQKSKDIVFQSMPPDTVLLNLENGFYFSTNKLGTEIWQHCDGETEIVALLDQLYQQFDTSLDQLKEDAMDFITLMVKEGLLTVDEDV